MAAWSYKPARTAAYGLGDAIDWRALSAFPFYLENDMSHTPGPWCQDKWGSLKTDSGKDVLLRGITTISAGSDERIAEAEANTRLISAAPDLLYALQVAITSMLDSGYSPKCATITLARSAISKAIDA